VRNCGPASRRAMCCPCRGESKPKFPAASRPPRRPRASSARRRHKPSMVRRPAAATLRPTPRLHRTPNGDLRRARWWARCLQVKFPEQLRTVRGELRPIAATLNKSLKSRGTPPSALATGVFFFRMTDRRERLTQLRDALAQRILVLDGAMGTMIQSYALEEKDFRGERFRAHPKDLRGNNDLCPSRGPTSSPRSTAATSRPVPTCSRPIRSTPK